MIVFFEPHADDGVLFACYTLLRLHPIVVTVCGKMRAQESQGVTEFERVAETIEAMKIVEPLDWRSWNHSDLNPKQEAVIGDMLKLETAIKPQEVWAPFWEEEGHRDHNLVSEAAHCVYGSRCKLYATYRRGHGRSETENEVSPEPTWPAIKLKAMACYTSQINLDSTRLWWNNWEREWIG